VFLAIADNNYARLKAASLLAESESFLKKLENFLLALTLSYGSPAVAWLFAISSV